MATMLRLRSPDVRAGAPPLVRGILPGSTKEEDAAMAIAIDPVCGMEVETEGAQLTVEHEGTTYYFCGRGCLLDFTEDPDTYLDPAHRPHM
jgi:YHS domain-containing protein